MSFDGFFLHHMVEELRAELLNGRIQKINQPFDQELVLQIRSNRQSHRLLLSAHPVFGRIQLTETTFENPAQPSTFIMVLRKYLQGAVIESIEQIENDRIVEITVSNKNEIGDDIQATLIIEKMCIRDRYSSPTNSSMYSAFFIASTSRSASIARRSRLDD